MWLGIDTSGETCAIALFEGDRFVRGREERIGRGHAERLVPMLAELAPGAVQAVVVVVGPGSYTGVRVGVAAARALGLAWRAPVYGVSALAIVAAAAFERCPTCTDVRASLAGDRGTIYSQRFAGGARSFGPDGPIEVAEPEHAVALKGGPETAAGRPSALSDLALVPVALRTLKPSPMYLRSSYAQAGGC